MKWYQDISTLLIAVVFLFSCKENGASGESKRDSSSIITVLISDNYLVLSPDEKESWFCDALELSVLKSSNIGMELRILESYRDDTDHLIILKDSNNYWTANFFNCKTSRNHEKKMQSFSYHRIALGSPKSGWKKFKDKFFELDLASLQKQRPLIDQFDTESVVMDVKIINEHKFTHNNFSDPYESEEPEVKKVAGIVNFLKEEFQIK